MEFFLLKNSINIQINNFRNYFKHKQNLNNFIKKYKAIFNKQKNNNLKNTT